MLYNSTLLVSNSKPREGIALSAMPILEYSTYHYNYHTLQQLTTEKYFTSDKLGL